MKPQIEKLTISPEESFRYFTKRTRAFPFKWHFHPEYELTLIPHSRGRRFVGDHIAAYGDGDLVLLGPNLPHTWFSDRQRAWHEAIVIQFREEFLGADFFACPELRRVATMLRAARQGLRFTGPARDQAAAAMREVGRVQGLARLSKLLLLLDRLARARPHRLASAAYQPLARQEDEARIGRICDYLEAHQERRITLPEVARLVHMSPASLSRFFTRTTGTSFNRYLNELRVGEACRLLVETSQSVAEICFATGFRNLANFNRRFRQIKRTTPRAYRQAFGQTNTST